MRIASGWPGAATADQLADSICPAGAARRFGLLVAD
jgi:hypothetical protein